MVDSGWDGVVLQLGWWRRLWTGTKGVAARGVVDLIDREKGSIFGVRWKSFPAAVAGGDLDTLVDKVDNPNLQSILQVLLSFEVIFDEEKLGSSEKVSLDDSCRKI
nr:hypothetical protein [Tanacetum cinerariifolium]